MSLDQTWPNHVYIYIKLVVMYLQCKQLSRFNRKIRGSGCRDIWPQVWLTCTIMIIMLFKTPTTLWTTQKTYYQQQNKHVQQYWRTLAKNIVNKPRWRVPHGSVTPWFPSDSKLSKKGRWQKAPKKGRHLADGPMGQCAFSTLQLVDGQEMTWACQVRVWLGAKGNGWDHRVFSNLASSNCQLSKPFSMKLMKNDRKSKTVGSGTNIIYMVGVELKMYIKFSIVCQIWGSKWGSNILAICLLRAIRLSFSPSWRDTVSRWPEFLGERCFCARKDSRAK